MLGGATVNSVLPDDGQKERFVLQIVSPEREDPLPGWREILAFSQNMGEGTRGRVESAVES